ncbi:hypothetical protein HPULCUR_004058 [Helicostylum pulchrum]|uniref:Uncharacterized protein n=1 Tax=Helicostylum pulchrum TaxID=562976 RepID=A0ABP9XWK8_9FUNG
MDENSKIPITEVRLRRGPLYVKVLVRTHFVLTLKRKNQMLYLKFMILLMSTILDSPDIHPSGESCLSFDNNEIVEQYENDDNESQETAAYNPDSYSDDLLLESPSQQVISLRKNKIK